MPEPNKTVVFLDVGDTLIFARRTMHEAIVAICKKAGLEVEEQFVRENAIEIKPTLGPMTTLDLEAFRAWWMRLYTELLNRCGYPGNIKKAQEELWSIWRSGTALRLFPDTRHSLDTLHRQGYRMAIISNWGDTLETALRSTGIRRYFEKVFGSYSLGVEKPDPEIFRLALREMAVHSRHAWHVGDSMDSDVEGAMAAGIRPILIDYFGKYDGVPPGVPLARSLSDVVQILDGKTQGKQIGNLEDSGTKRYLASTWKNR